MPKPNWSIWVLLLNSQLFATTRWQAPDQVVLHCYQKSFRPIGLIATIVAGRTGKGNNGNIFVTCDVNNAAALIYALIFQAAKSVIATIRENELRGRETGKL